MNIDINRVKIIITIPIENVEKVRNEICEIGTDIIEIILIVACSQNVLTYLSLMIILIHILEKIIS